MSSEDVDRKAWKWGLGLSYIIAVATIWIAASFVVQSVVDAGVSPFLVTYICNSLFVVLIPIVEIGRYLEDYHGGLLFWRSEKSEPDLEGRLGESEQAILLNDAINEVNESLIIEELDDVSELLQTENVGGGFVDQVDLIENVDNQLDEKGRWTRYRVAKVSLLICPFWFFAQLTFNLSLKYTTVTVSEFGFLIIALSYVSHNVLKTESNNEPVRPLVMVQPLTTVQTWIKRRLDS